MICMKKTDKNRWFAFVKSAIAPVSLQDQQAGNENPNFLSRKVPEILVVNY